MSDKSRPLGTQSPKTFTVDDFVEVRVIASGDDCVVYDFDPHAKGLRLKEMHRTSTVAPIDLAEVPESSIDAERADNVPVWLIVHRSIFPGAIVTARPIGLLMIQTGSIEQRSVIAVAAIDPEFDAIQASSDLPADQRRALIEYACGDRTDAQVRWEPAVAARDWIHQAKQQTRLARARQAKHRSLLPAWKPLGYLVAGARRSNETEPNSDAEYAYHQLPHRFQKYVDEYLAPDERILFAVNRPMIKSARQRAWLSRATLQEGILFLTDQQVSLVAEIVPPDSANIRYGYIAQTVPPERVHSIEVDGSHSDTAVLKVTACSRSQHGLEWEFPRAAIDELHEAAKLLAGWQPRTDDQRLRRAEAIEPFKVPLRDPAANDPKAMVPLIERLEEAIRHEVNEDEVILAQALLPGWVERRDWAEAIVVTTKHFWRVPDPQARRSVQAIELAKVASIEFSMSILESYLILYHVQHGRVHTQRILFPYTGVGFKECFTALRRQTALLVS